MTSPPIIPTTPVFDTSRRRRWFRWTLVTVALAVGSGLAVARYRATRPDYRMLRGTEALQNQNWDRVEEYIQLLEKSQASDHAAVLRGELHLARREPELALREFNTVQTDGPLRTRAAGKAGKCLLELGEVREAHRVLSYVVEQSPDDADAHRGLAGIAYDLGQMPTAVEHLERVAELDPTDSRPHRLMGLIYKDLNQFDKLEAAYQEAIRRGLSPAARADVALELAEARVQEKKYAEALEALDAVGRTTPELPDAVAVRIEALHGLGEREKAFALANRMVAAAANDGPFHRLRGQLNLDKGDTAAAVADLEQAALRAPAHYQTQYLLAQAYAAAGRTDEAARTQVKARDIRTDLDRATALTREAIEKPWDPIVRQRLAELAERRGDAKLAAVWRAAATACTRGLR